MAIQRNSNENMMDVGSKLQLISPMNTESAFLYHFSAFILYHVITSGDIFPNGSDFRALIAPASLQSKPLETRNDFDRTNVDKARGLCIRWNMQPVFVPISLIAL